MASRPRTTLASFRYKSARPRPRQRHTLGRTCDVENAHFMSGTCAGHTRLQRVSTLPAKPQPFRSDEKRRGLSDQHIYLCHVLNRCEILSSFASGQQSGGTRLRCTSRKSRQVWNTFKLEALLRCFHQRSTPVGVIDWRLKMLRSVIPAVAGVRAQLAAFTCMTTLRVRMRPAALLPNAICAMNYACCV